MDKRKLTKLEWIALMVSITMVVASFYSLMVQRRQTVLIARNSIPGLINAGMANTVMDDNFIRNVLMLHSDSADQREYYIRQIGQASAESDIYLIKYQETIVEKEDSENFGQLLEMRRAYTTSREQFFDSIRADRTEEAEKFFKLVLVPAYSQYSVASHKLFARNADAGLSRGESALKASLLSPIFAVTSAIAVFLVGRLSRSLWPGAKEFRPTSTPQTAKANFL